MNPHGKPPQGLLQSRRQSPPRRSLAGISPTMSPPTTSSLPPRNTKRRNVFSANTDSQPDIDSGLGNAPDDNIQNNPHPSSKVRIVYRDEEERKLHEKVETLMTQIESLHKDRCDMAKKLRGVEAELTLKKAAVLDFKACCGPYCNNSSNLEKAAQSLYADLLPSSNEQDSQLLKSIVSTARKEAGEVNQKLQEKNQKLAEVDAQLISLRKDLQTVREENDNLEAANGRLNNELGVETANSLKRETSFIAGMNMVQKHQRERITRAEADCSHIAKLEEECSKLKPLFQEQLSKNVLSRSIQTQNISRLEKEKNTLLADKQVAEGKLQYKQEKIESLQRSKDELEKKIEKLTKNKKGQAVADESRQLQDRLDLQITNIQSDRDSLAQQLENNKVVISELQTLLKSKDEEIQQLSNRVEDLNDETQVEVYAFQTCFTRCYVYAKTNLAMVRSNR
ncbi:hypothetical protein GGU10DRAFT_379505 [Lentinula aff. detonsa]|uniref:Uncharacterized protein n=1 Tax=Lentinula aff. detonsa TaxID=2804958 RepID=A0AA38KLD4_9AGAR|nr:hypothetical protein GGU10DRAFT_379505 [Lentinula aff. detonsa]